MTITQTVNIPAKGPRIIEVPREVPSGQVILTFTPLSEPAAGETVKFTDATREQVLAAGDDILNKHHAAFTALAK